RADIEQWAAADAANRALLDSLARRWTVARASASWDVDAAWARLQGNLRGAHHAHAADDVAAADPARRRPDAGRVISIATRRPRRFSTWLLPIAAVVVLAVGVTTVWRSQNRVPAN